MRKSATGGFTYIELLVSLAILGMLAVAFSSSLGFGRQVWLRADEYAEREVQAVLRGKLRTWLGEISSQSGIEGDQNAFSFSVETRSTPDGDIFRLDVNVEKEKSGSEEEIWIRLLGYGADDTVVFEDRRVLDSDLRNIWFEYFGRASPDAELKWHSEWHAPSGNLRLFKLTASGTSGNLFIPFSERVGHMGTHRVISASSLVPPD